MILSVFSSILDESGFLVPRTVPATAILFTEPPASTNRRNFISSRSKRSQNGCVRPLIPLGQKLSKVGQKFPPIFSDILKPVMKVQSKLAMLKAMILEKLRLQCLFPKLLHPFLPILSHFSCKLGLNNDGFMETPTKQNISCNDLEIEQKEISHRLDLPHFENTNLQVRTMDNCFPEMEETLYGARTLTKLVNDESCQDQRYAAVCEELFSQDKIIMEAGCETIG